MRKGRQFNQIEEEEERDLFRTNKEKELYSKSEREQMGSFVNRKPIRQQQQVNDGDENEDLDTFEAEANQQDETFNKLVNLHKLILKNRITKSNAFDINIGRVELSRYSWVNSSNFLKNLSEILGYKVDNIYQDSYSLLGMLNRTDKDDNEQQNGDKDQKQQKNMKDISSEELLKKVNRYSSILNFGAKTLESKIENIDVNKYDIEFDLDPLLKQTLSQFDDSSNKGLFLTNTYLDKDMQLKLESQVENQNQINEEDEEDDENTENQITDPEDVPKSHYLRFIKGESSKLNLGKVDKLCPKLMKFKGKVEDDAKKLNINFNLTDSEFVSYTVKKDKKDQDLNQETEFDGHYYADPLDELNQLVNEEFEQQEEFEEAKGQYEYEKKPIEGEDDQENDEGQMQDDIDEEDEEDKKQDDEDKENDEDEEEKDGNEDEDDIQVFDPIIAEDKLKNIGKGKIDKELKDKLNQSKQNEKKSKKRKKNLLQKDQEDQENAVKKQTNEFRFEFDELEMDEDKEMCFGTHKKKLNTIDLRKININQKIKHDNLGMFDFGITDVLFDQFTLMKGQVYQEEEIQENKDFGGLIAQCENDENQEYQDFEGFDLQQEQLLQNQEDDEEEEPDDFDDIFANNQNNERSQVRIRDLKKKVWRYIQHQNNKKQKKMKKKQQEKQLSFQTVLSDIPNIMGEVSKKISLQSSFITILHLCNENDLRLDDSNQDCANFSIEKDKQAILIQEQQEKEKEKNKNKKKKQINIINEQDEEQQQQQQDQEQKQTEEKEEVQKDKIENEEEKQIDNTEQEQENKEQEIKQNGNQEKAHHQNGDQEIDRENEEENDNLQEKKSKLQQQQQETQEKDDEKMDIE